MATRRTVLSQDELWQAVEEWAEKHMGETARGFHASAVIALVDGQLRPVIEVSYEVE